MRKPKLYISWLNMIENSMNKPNSIFYDLICYEWSFVCSSIDSQVHFNLFCLSTEQAQFLII